ncbi:MAG: sterol desaturase family protein [Kordiimonadaceae bacterium]|nr:sterol desaturase family protein [Kordiimonadaceae bacterium]
MADIGITLAHYASHRIDALWRLHAVHHSIKRMYGFNGLMKHPLHQLLETVAGTTPLLLMGIPQDVLSLLIVAVLLQLLLQHSNVAYFVGPLRHVLVVNVLHRFHHLKTGEEGDVNFGLFTTFTDHLLGTAFYDEGKVIGSEDLGIAAQPNYPVSYLKQLAQPFRKQESVDYSALITDQIRDNQQ